jgi:hypothetical protein
MNDAFKKLRVFRGMGIMAAFAIHNGRFNLKM